MKRIRVLGIAAVIILLLGMTGAAFAEQIASIEGLPEWPLPALSGEGVWVVSDGGAQYAGGYASESIKTITGLGKVTAAAADALGLYTYPNDPGNPTLELRSSDGAVLYAASIPGERVVRHIQPMEGRIALLTSPLSSAEDEGNPYHGHDLYLLDRETGKWSGPLMQMAMSAAPAEDGQLLVMYWDETFSTVTDLLNPDTGGRTMIQDGTGGNYDGLSYAGPDKVYLVGFGDVFLYDSKTGKRDMVFELDGDFIRGDMAVLGPILAVATNQGVKVYDFTRQPETDTTLTIVNCYSMEVRLEAVRDWFKQAHPNVKISISEIDYEKLNVAIMAQDEELDILCLGYDEYESFARQGALVDLMQSDALRESLGEWVSGAYDPLRIDGGLYSLPMDITPDIFILDGPLYRGSGMDWPQDRPLSWTELADLSEAAGLGQPGKPALYADDIYYPWMMWQYTSMQTAKQGRVDFDTPLFRELMETHKRMVTSNAVIQYNWDGPNGDTVARLSSWYAAREEDAERRMLPTLDGEHVLPAQPTLLAISRSSGRAELALEFMERYATPEVQNKAYYVNLTDLLLKDIGGYQRDTFFDDPDYTDEDLAYREMMLAHWVPQRFYDDLRVYCGSGVMQDYLDGRIDLDRLIGLLQAKIDMMQME